MPAVMESTRRGFAQQEEAYAPSDSISPKWEAKLASLSKPRRVSMYGALKGKVKMTVDFDAPLEDFAECM